MQTDKAGQYIINDGMTAWGRMVKRAADFLFALVGLLLVSPLLLACYVAVKCAHDGPVIFRQERIGRWGRPFYIYKFRTMVDDVETNGPQLCNDDHDERLTGVGRILRKHHLDELPQLWNVLRGDMSLVGPRPERQYFIDKIMEHDVRYPFLYQVRPGVTSYATIYNGYTDTMEKMLIRLQMDLDYLEKRSCWQDLKIIVLTVVKTISGRV